MMYGVFSTFPSFTRKNNQHKAIYIYAYHRLIMFQICVSVSCRLGSALQNREIGESPLKWKYVSRNLEA